MIENNLETALVMVVVICKTAPEHVAPGRQRSYFLSCQYQI